MASWCREICDLQCEGKESILYELVMDQLIYSNWIVMTHFTISRVSFLMEAYKFPLYLS